MPAIRPPMRGDHQVIHSLFQVTDLLKEPLGSLILDSNGYIIDSRPLLCCFPGGFIIREGEEADRASLDLDEGWLRRFSERMTSACSRDPLFVKQPEHLK